MKENIYKLIFTIILIAGVFFSFFIFNRANVYKVEILKAQLDEEEAEKIRKEEILTQNDLDQILEELKLFKRISCKKEIQSEVGLGTILEIDKNFFEKNTKEVKPIASLTKLMTAVVALENLNDDEIIYISKGAEAAFGDFGNFKWGEGFSLKDLINGMLLSSSNDAAVALAEKIGVKQFINLMNRKAKEIGMKNTIFYDPTGLSVSNRSTAEDLLKLVNYILSSHLKIFEITREPQIVIKEVNTQKEKIIRNENKLVKNNAFLGGKTGFLLNIQKGGMLSLFRFSNYTVLIVILDGDWEARYKDTLNILSCLSIH
jgi:D-alanyl-D-alanine carboxypeptidase